MSSSKSFIEDPAWIPDNGFDFAHHSEPVEEKLSGMTGLNIGMTRTKEKMITVPEIEQIIQSAIPDAQVQAFDMTGTGDHFNITVHSSSFSGKTLIEQHQMVFSALGSEMDKRIHAVQLKTKAIKL